MAVKKKFDSANICLILLWNILTTKEYWMKIVGMLMKNGKKILTNGVKNKCGYGL